MMTPQMLQRILAETSVSENEISKSILVPCFEKISWKRGYALRDIRFIGGASEEGNDIEYYEVVGPDEHRFYTGIQMKKGNLSPQVAKELALQGHRAIKKTLKDISTGSTYQISRWVVATTGTISSQARETISADLKDYGRTLSFWDGLQLSEMLVRNYYDETMSVLGVGSMMAGSENIRITWWAPDEPQLLVENFDSTDWTTIDLARSIPPDTGTGIFLTVVPKGKSHPSVACVVRSSKGEVVIDSSMSQISPFMLQLQDGETAIEAKLASSSRPVDVLARGYQSEL